MQCLNFFILIKMKTSSLPLFSLLLIALAFNPLPGAAQDAPDPVLDIEGKELRSGVDYYILPVFRGRGGGLTLASVGNKTCPLDVVQDRLEVLLDYILYLFISSYC